ncbi:hypothetical protein HU200_033140 [Digitaria exilis]|uniref:RNase H type-1 domain-containing protein n=1 Tax=Digitaria exilis TaxID=1010633 RepID=A0A835BLI7_9POAL|nr:hypothetical protein HU200_033140 [Digitaria exilis]
METASGRCLSCLVYASWLHFTWNPAPAAVMHLSDAAWGLAVARPSPADLGGRGSAAATGLGERSSSSSRRRLPPRPAKTEQRTTPARSKEKTKRVKGNLVIPSVKEGKSEDDTWGFDLNTGKAGFGYIARDHLGNVAFSGWSSDQLCKSAKEVECVAALTGVRQALSVFQGPIWLESDCLVLAQELKSPSPNRSDSCFVIEDTTELEMDARITAGHLHAPGPAPPMPLIASFLESTTSADWNVQT